METNHRAFPLIFLFATIICSCTPSINSAEELQAYIAQEKNGLTKVKSLGPVSCKVSYRPPDLLVAQELRKINMTSEEIQDLYDSYGAFVHFLVSFSVAGKEIEAYNLQGDFGERVNVLAFQMGQHLHLLSDTKDTINVVDYQYQRTFGAGSSTDLLFAFDRAQLEKSK